MFPLLAGNYPVKLLQEILIWGVFAMSLDVLMGYAGMVSFGHSAFFGVGAYVAALALTRWPGLNAGFVLPALLSAGLAALVVGYFSIRVGGVFFIMLTLAFSQMFFALAFQLELARLQRRHLRGAASRAPRRLRSRAPVAVSSLRGHLRRRQARPSSCGGWCARPSGTCCAASTTTRCAWRRWATR